MYHRHRPPFSKRGVLSSGWKPKEGSADALLQLVECHNLLLLQLIGVGIKGLKSGLAHSGVDFNKVTPGSRMFCETKNFI